MRVLRCLAFAVSAGTLASCGPGPAPDWTQEDGYRWREVAPSTGALGGLLGKREGFHRRDDTGIEFTNKLDREVSLEREHLLVGSGVSIGDVDGDGLPDVYLTRLDGPNVLYRNLGDFRFEDITERAGVAAPDRFSSGTTMADVDGDGDLDLLVAALGGPNALYQNDGSGVFTDVTQQAGLRSEFASMTMALADIEGDGDLDLYVANYKRESAADVLLPFERQNVRMVDEVGDSLVVTDEFAGHFRMEELYGRMTAVEQAEPDWLYLNNGSGRFFPVSWTDGRFLDRDGRALERPLDDYAMAARFYDVDDDDDPDLYVVHDFDDPDAFWINNGRGGFRLARPQAIRNTSHSAMAVDFADIDRDGHVDFFVADMRSLDRASRLRQQLPQILAPKTLGMDEGVPQFPRNTLFWNRGDGTFAQIAEMAGVDASEWTWTSLFLDVDLDGYEDLLVTNGHGRDWQDGDAMERTARLQGVIDWTEAKSYYPELATRNMAFRNGGDLSFEEVGEDWGFSVGPDVSHGMAAGDLDGDGDLDLVVNRLHDPALVFRNEARQGRVAVRLLGRAPNTGGIGARVRLLGGAVPVQEKEVTAGGLYLSGSGPTLVFAVGEAGEEEPMRLEVEWRGGGLSVIEDVRSNREYEIEQEGTESPGEAPPLESSSPGGPWFSEVVAVNPPTHVDAAFDDIARQPLMSEQWSRSGPGVGWVDLEDDGDADLVLPTGAGGRLAVWRNEEGRLGALEMWGEVSDFDQTGVAAIPDGSGGRRLLVGQSSYQAPAFGEPSVGTLGMVRAERVPAVLAVGPAGSGAADTAAAGVAMSTAEAGGGVAPARTITDSVTISADPVVGGLESSVGPTAVADVDGDGRLDLFVGGRLLPGRYPQPATSRIFRGSPSGFTPPDISDSTFVDLGMVSGAVFSDVDVDGDPDLLLALDWGTPRLFLNDGGRFEDASSAWGLGDLSGRWNGVATGDLNGDGRPDAVLTGWGQNVERRPRPGRPLELVHGDLDEDGRWDLVLAQKASRRGPLYPLERFERLRVVFPSIGERMETFAAYGDATLAEILDRDLDRLPRLVAEHYEHVTLLSRDGGGWDVVALPAQAQMAPAFGVAIADLDGDGAEDVVLSHNFSATDSWSPRLDGGRALVLRGDGSGGLEPVRGQTSGIEVYGDGRGVAISDFDLDGRADVAVAENAGPIHVYRNLAAAPGVRVRVDGGASNPDGLGAWVRLVYGDRRGPLREIQGGSGYASWNDPVQLLGIEEGSEPTGVEVRWPDGETEVVSLAPGQRDVRLRREG